jgi:hypothetical protein
MKPFMRSVARGGLVLALAADPLRAQQPTGTGSTNPRLLPDISVVGDLIFDLSRRSTQEDGRRFSVREIELALQAAVDPYFRGDVFLGYSDVEGVAIEQAFLTATALPWQVEGRLGRFIMPFGKQNLTHRHDLHTIDYPYVIQRFLGEEGLKGTGLHASKVFSPFGFYQEFIVSAVDHLGDDEGLTPQEPSSAELSGLGYMARLRNYWDLTPNANLEISASASTGKRAQPLDVPDEINAVNARQSVLGFDITYRWRPLQQGLYKSFILQAELMRQLNEADPTLPDDVTPDAYLGPRQNFNGAYIFSRYQLSRRGYLGARGDFLQDPESDGDNLTAASAYYEFYPSEFSKILAGYERLWPAASTSQGRFIIQATFALGPHRPHPF